MPDKKSIRPILPKRRLPLNSVGGTLSRRMLARTKPLSTPFSTILNEYGGWCAKSHRQSQGHAELVAGGGLLHHFAAHQESNTKRPKSNIPHPQHCHSPDIHSTFSKLPTQGRHPLVLGNRCNCAHRICPPPNLSTSGIFSRCSALTQKSFRALRQKKLCCARHGSPAGSIHRICRRFWRRR